MNTDNLNIFDVILGDCPEIFCKGLSDWGKLSVWQQLELATRAESQLAPERPPDQYCIARKGLTIMELLENNVYSWSWLKAVDFVSSFLSVKLVCGRGELHITEDVATTLNQLDDFINVVTGSADQDGGAEMRSLLEYWVMIGDDFAADVFEKLHPEGKRILSELASDADSSISLQMFALLQEEVTDPDINPDENL